jgi:hypothetical protein
MKSLTNSLCTNQILPTPSKLQQIYDERCNKLLDFVIWHRHEAIMASPTSSLGSCVDFGVNPFTRAARSRSTTGARSRMYFRSSLIFQSGSKELIWVFHKNGKWVLNIISPAFFHRAEVYPEDREYAEFQSRALVGYRLAL